MQNTTMIENQMNSLKPLSPKQQRRINLETLALNIVAKMKEKRDSAKKKK